MANMPILLYILQLLMADKHAAVKTLILTLSMKFSIQASIQTSLTPFRKIKQAGNLFVF
jgi:hypothetical protein